MESGAASTTAGEHCPQRLDFGNKGVAKRLGLLFLGAIPHACGPKDFLALRSWETVPERAWELSRSSQNCGTSASRPFPQGSGRVSRRRSG